MEGSALCPPVASERTGKHTGTRAHMHTIRAKMLQRCLGCLGDVDHLFELLENEARGGKWT